MTVHTDPVRAGGKGKGKVVDGHEKGEEGRDFKGRGGPANEDDAPAPRP